MVHELEDMVSNVISPYNQANLQSVSLRNRILNILSILDEEIN